ncbi:PAS domain S-box protein [Ochrobactrum soli]|uniref:ATP-binding protein n=1 Tax=Ochrobactrum soli TaxID=2448455 RepID=UPI000EF22C55|nr:ATP-binding protein [[Ochrobactrum] soli]RLL71593.1 PAS domain S-box protein [[Ochrobactrum] soli]
MNSLKRIDRRTITLYWLATAIVACVVLLGAAIIIYRDYNNRINAAGQQVMSLAQALAEHTTQVFTKLDVLSWALVEDQTDMIVDEIMLSEVMRRRAAAEPAVMGIATIDKNGIVTASGMDDYPIGRNVSNAKNYRILSQENSPQVSISEPYRASNGIPDGAGGWAMNYARRINDHKGNFNGYVLIVANEAYLYGFYRRFEDQHGLILGLIGKDGIIRASNEDAANGDTISGNMEQHINEGDGIRIETSRRTGEECIYAHYQTAAAPLVALVGVPTAPIYRSWLIASSLTLGALSALFAALVAIGILLGKFVKNRNALTISEIQVAGERREKEFLETIVNTGAVLMMVTDSKGKVLVANHAIRELFPEIQHEDENGDPVSHILGKLFSEVVDELPWQAINNVSLPSGQKRALSWSVSPILNPKGDLKNVVAIGLDITERREAELAIYQSGKLITLGEVATGIAHEINQPLATLAMGIFNLQTREEQDRLDRVTIKEGLAAAASQVERAAKIVKHMRVYGHRGGGDLVAIDPADAIDGVLTMIGRQIQNQGIEIKYSRNPADGRVLAELVLLEQILFNLILNARDAILGDRNHEAETGSFIEIRLENTAPDQETIVVYDSGPGIQAEIVDRIFDPFFTTKPVGKGTGLGLSLSYGMAQDMGGKLSASNGAMGAEFRLTLRKAQAAQGNT